MVLPVSDSFPEALIRRVIELVFFCGEEDSKIIKRRFSGYCTLRPLASSFVSMFRLPFGVIGQKPFL